MSTEININKNIYNSDGTVNNNRTVDLDGNTINFNDGKVGVNITPTAPLHVQTIAVPSANESIARFTVSDAAGAALTILNASSVDGRFVPEISALQGLNTDIAFKQTSYIQPTQDSGSTPVTIFSTGLSTLAAIVTRPLYQFRNAGTNLLTILADGKVGIGTTTPSTSLHVRSTAIPSAGEAIARFDVSDSSAYLQVANGTSTNAAFAPSVQGRQVGTSTQSALQTEGIIDSVDDTGTTPVTIFKTRLATLAQVVTRPVFQFSNWTSDIMTMLANGNVGIGTTTPGEKLEVNGKTKTTTFQMTTTPTAGYVLTSDASGNGSWSAAAGGLTYFTEAQSTAAPNATVPVDSLTAVSAATDADFALKPKGTGALLVAIPDNTATGGNKRGANAVDLQTTRNTNTQVASGPGSILIGQYGTSSGTGSISIGYSNVSNGTYTVAIGSSNTASNNQSTCVGFSNSVTGANWGHCFGQSNTVGGTYGTAVGYSNTTGGSSSISCGASNVTGLDYSRSYCSTLGANNRAEESNSTAIGVYAGTFGVQGRYAYSNGRFSTTGDSQKGLFVLRIATTGNTATVLTTNNSAASTNNQIVLSNQSAYGFTGTIVGKQSGSTNAAMWKVEGLIARGANAVSTVLTTSTVTLVSNAPGWGTPNLSADPFNGGLQIQVVGAVATNIQWTATIDTTEVIYA